MILDCYEFYLWSTGQLRVPPLTSKQSSSNARIRKIKVRKNNGAQHHESSGLKQEVRNDQKDWQGIRINKKVTALVLCLLLSSSLAHASVESSLLGLKTVLLGSILPIFAVMGLGFAAFSFITGNPNAKQHLTYSMIGAVVLFGAQSIVDLIERLVR